jgi:hypothetical protein
MLLRLLDDLGWLWNVLRPRTPAEREAARQPMALSVALDAFERRNPNHPEVLRNAAQREVWRRQREGRRPHDA